MCPRGPPELLKASREIIAPQAGTRLAWHHSVGLDIVMATADTDSYCFSFTSKGLVWLRLLKKKLTDLDVHSSVYLKSHSVYLTLAEAAYNIKVHCDVKVQWVYLVALIFFKSVQTIYLCLHLSEEHLSDRENLPCLPKACVLSSSKHSVLHFCKYHSISLPVQKSCLSVRIWCQMFGL